MDILVGFFSSERSGSINGIVCNWLSFIMKNQSTVIESTNNHQTYHVTVIENNFSQLKYQKFSIHNDNH